MSDTKSSNIQIKIDEVQDAQVVHDLDALQLNYGGVSHAVMNASLREAYGFKSEVAQSVTNVREAANILREKLRHENSKHADISRRDAENLVKQLDAVSPGVVDLSCMLNKQPNPEDFRFPKRAAYLIPKARRRLTKAKYAFVDPQIIVDAATSLAYHIPVISPVELVHRISYYLSNMNMITDGLAIATATRRLVHAAALDAQMRKKEDNADIAPERIKKVAASIVAIEDFMSAVKQQEIEKYAAEQARKQQGPVTKPSKNNGRIYAQDMLIAATPSLVVNNG